MTDPRDDEGRRPLWASSLAEQPRTDDVTVHRVETSSVAEPEADAGPQIPGRAILAVLAAVVLALLVILGDHVRPTLSQEVSSGWGSIPMTCTATRLESEANRAIELFSCRATRGTLPTGRYRTPDISWKSDIDRREAVATDIRITADGELHGWAAYVTGFG